MIIEQIVDFSSVYFIHWYSDWKVTLVTLPIINTLIEKVLNGKLLQALHRKSFTWACLPVGENSDGSRIENKIHDRRDWVRIQVLSWFVLSESVVEIELSILNIASNTIHFVAILMYYNLRVWEGNRVDLARGQFFLKNWSLLYAHANFKLVCWGMLNKEKIVYQ